MIFFSPLKVFVLAILLSLLTALSGCGGDDFHLNNKPGAGLQLDVPVQPLVSWQADNGKTRVILQFSVRDGTGLPLPDDKFDVEMRVDNRPPEVESLLSQSSQELAVNLYVAMVLDASYSMTQHIPEAFGPMKTAAKDSYQEILHLWDQRAGNVKFSLIWFDEVMHQSQNWQPSDILSIPTPDSGTATKLFSAVNVMADHLQDEYNNGVFNGPRDQYVMLVFSDGNDNYSYLDNSPTAAYIPARVLEQSLETGNGASYRLFGTPSTTLNAAKQAIANHPRLTTHVIGLGNDINKDELAQIAAAGNGTFVSNPSSENIADLFDRVLKEFTTLQTRGAEIPLQPGDYNFTLTVSNKSSGHKDSYTFRFHAGDQDAAVLQTP